jgi:Holliday junction resolvase RusA-like endonuclease
MISLMMPWPCSVNTAYRNVPHVGRVKTKAYKKWAEEADRWLEKQVLDGLRLPLIPMTGWLRVTICGNPPDRRKRDYSNIIKVVEDQLAGWRVFYNDNQIKDIRCYEDPHKEDEKRRTISPGAIMVTVEPLPGVAPG